MNKYFMSLLIMTSVLIGCSKSDNKLDSAESMQLTKTNNINSVEPIQFSTNTLAFQDYNEFIGTVCELIQMTPGEKENWFKNKTGFVSQEQAANMVSEQLMKCETLTQALQLRSGYSQFIFNENATETDFTPYIPSSSFGYSMVCNAYGDVEIGGKIVNMNDIKSYDETWEAQTEKRYKNNMTKGVQTSVNYVHSWTNSRKMWVEAFNMTFYGMQGTVTRRSVVLRLNAQQKICAIFCVWNTYTNNFQFVRHEFGSSGFEGDFMPKLYNGQTVSVSGGNSTALSIGDLTSGNITASMKVCTQGVGIANQGVLQINNPRAVTFNAATGKYSW